MLPRTIIPRPKVYFPKTRNNYRKYNNADWDWNDIFEEIETLKITEANYIKIVSTKYNIKYETLRKKYNKWVSNDKIPVIMKETRGIHNRLFTVDEERDLFEYIKEVYIDGNLFFDNECLKLLAIKKWNLIHPDEKDLFKASDGWITDFKYRWKLSSLKIKYIKNTTNEINEKTDKRFHKICRDLSMNIDKKYIFNMDETFWRIINGNFSVIGITGSDNRKVLSKTNMKTGYTAIFIISAAGDFLKPIIVLK
jgi:hypothetical protein